MSDEQQRPTSTTGDEHIEDDAHEEQQTVHFSVVFDDVDEAATTTTALGATGPDGAGTAMNADSDDASSQSQPQSQDDDIVRSNAERVNATPNLAQTGATNPSDGHVRQDESSDATHHLAAGIDREFNSHHEDDILLKSYPTFALDHVTVRDHKSGRTLLDDVQMGFQARKLYAVVTDDDEQRVALLNVLGGFGKPDRGQVMLKSADLATLLPSEVRGHRIGLVPQRFALREDLDATANIVYAMDATQRTFLKPKPILAHELLTSVGLDAPAAGEPVGQFTALNQRRVAIARAISCEATAIVIDEPTADLDEDDGKIIRKLLAKLAHSGADARCVVMLTTNDADIDAADRYFEL